MDERTVRVLEFDKIKEMVCRHGVSEPGLEKIKSMPVYKDKELIDFKQDETSEAVRIILGKDNIPFGGIYDLKESLQKAVIGSALTPGQLLKTADTLRTGRIIHNSAKNIEEDFSIIPSMAKKIIVLKDVENRIYGSIVNDDELSDNASPLLNSIRRNIRSINSSIRNKLNAIVNSQQYRKILQEPIITIRNGRHVVPVKQEYRGSFKGIVHDQSASGATLFIEPMAVVELNNELSRLTSEEYREIERILRELTQLVGENKDSIENNVEILSELDFIFARAKFSLEMECTRPVINEDRHVMLLSARHPLIEREKVVPVDIFLGKEFNTLVITGPNTGGKTVLLKTAGLISLMAQAGLHVPAGQGTETGVFKSIFADIGDEQSIEQSLSTFSSHMTNIINILAEADDQSLVLLDELGAGTDPTEGAALAISILNYLLKKNVRTAATTHYSELKEYALMQEGVENGSVEFDIQTLSPTYKLNIGVPGKSNAFEISRRLGLRDDIISDARQHITGEKVRFEDIVSSLESNRQAAEKERETAENDRFHAAALRIEYEQKVDTIESLKNKVLKQAREEAKLILQEAKEDAEKIIKELRELRSSSDDGNMNKDMESIRTSLGRRINAMDEEIYRQEQGKAHTAKPPENLKIGETVYIANLDKKGIVISIPDDNGDLQVQVGIMKVKANIKTLNRVKEEPQRAEKSFSQLKLNNEKIVSDRIYLRGQPLEEALMNCDKFLDDAYVAGLSEVTVIHGKGEGILRNGIHDSLKRHPHVDKFRLGRYGEGGIGVTVVQLKQRL